MTTIAIGTKVQRKGSKVVWTVSGNDEFAQSSNGPVRINDTPTEIQISCLPKGHSSRMFNWVKIDQFHKNWRAVKEAA